MTEDLGTPTRPHALTGEQWRLEVRTDDPPSPSADERWIRSDLDSGDRIATLKCGDGTEIPLFATGSAEETVREARRFRVGGQTVYAPLAPVGEAAFPERRVQHDGQTHAFHDRVAPGYAIPDSGTDQWRFYEGSGDTLSNSVGSVSATNNGASWVSDTKYTGGFALNFTLDDYWVTDTTFINDGDYTVMSWVNITDADNFARIYQSGSDPTTTTPRGFDLWIDTSESPTRVTLNHYDQSFTNVVDTNLNIDDGNDYFVVIAGSGDNGELYIYDTSQQIFYDSGSGFRALGQEPLMGMAGDGRYVNGTMDAPTVSATTQMTQADIETVWQDTMR